jgi:hypothetical protein
VLTFGIRAFLSVPDDAPALAVLEKDEIAIRYKLHQNNQYNCDNQGGCKANQMFLYSPNLSVTPALQYARPNSISSALTACHPFMLE